MGETLNITLMTNSGPLSRLQVWISIAMIGLKLILFWRLRQLRQRQPLQPLNAVEQQNPITTKDDNKMNIAIAELLALFSSVAQLAIHDTHKMNIINALVAGVSAATQEYQQGVNVPPALGAAVTPLQNVAA